MSMKAKKKSQPLRANRTQRHASRRTMAELMEMEWSSRAAAEKDLKASGFKPSGADYELIEVGGKWKIGDPPSEPAAKKKAAGKKAEQPTKAAPKKKAEHPADAEMRAKAEQASLGYVVIFVRGGPGGNLAVDCSTIEEARAQKMRLDTEFGQHGRRAMIYAKQPNGRAPVPVTEDDAPEVEPQREQAKPEAKPEPQASEAEPQNDLSGLPADQHYYIRIPAMPGFSVAKCALLIAQQGIEGDPIADLEIVGARDNKVHRKIDGRIGGGAAARKRGRQPRLDLGERTERAPRKAAAPRSSGGQKRPDEAATKKIIAMAQRKQGVKRTEMSDLNDGVVINWKGFLESHGKRQGLKLGPVNKDGPTPIYFLVKA